MVALRSVTGEGSGSEVDARSRPLCLASTNELASDLQGHSQMVVGLPLGL